MYQATRSQLNGASRLNEFGRQKRTQAESNLDISFRRLGATDERCGRSAEGESLEVSAFALVPVEKPVREAERDQNGSAK
jgi:hypothetical protein